MVKKAYNKKIGVVTTARITHATPACVYANSADRNWESSSAEVSAAQREKIEHYGHDPEGGCNAVQKDISTQLIDAMLGEGPDVSFILKMKILRYKIEVLQYEMKIL